MSDENSYRPRCKHLYCNKSMLVFGESFQNDPDYQAGMGEFWCLLTTRAQGPDEGDVSLESCCDAQRSCFKEY